ncbi:transmembrane protein, putative (macronuclear) [Tetrahymena thermophila SB210]|uniref:Transmembrane protein, putative n=1 Tax=Tetrahymena thermophila (strain SB210) TaxID=312017 RepID=I7M477_TETTS|nr:transmembrane protein, putative [Tetrahymena thermophila SB210]EAS05109.2 transmembrane protein, putative [Tetrahymena thermophila SB210]|eukprot:XP_001025354.2 transmembrane protein, putative [Tetrahymena thermophila SB210]
MFNFRKTQSFPLVQLQNSYITLNSLNVSQNGNNIKLLSALSLKINECDFIQNQSQNGGAIFIYGLLEKFTLQKTRILQNQAFSSGGGIYFEDNFSQEWSIDYESQISGNKALIGGGIRIVNKLSKTEYPNGYPFISVIQKNTASIYGNNACTFLKNILVEDNNESNLNPNEEITNKITQYSFNFSKYYNQIQYGQIQLSKFNSGGNLQLKIYLLDEDNRKLTFEKEMISQSIYPSDILDELKYISIFTDLGQNKQLQLTGEIILNYNMYDASQSCFLINQLTVSGQSLSQRQFLIKFQLNQYQQQVIQILVDVQFRDCLLGEISLSPTTGIQICYFCSEGSYSLANPRLDIQNTNLQCQKCPATADRCIGNQIYLKNGYWRIDQTTDEILTCDSSINSCQAQNPQSSIQGCIEGYIGPLCEECDIKQQVWKSNSTSAFSKYVSSFYSKKCISSQTLRILNNVIIQGKCIFYLSQNI